MLPNEEREMAEELKTSRTAVRRLPVRGIYERETVEAILDEGLICHVGFVHEGTPYVIPTGYGRRGEELLIHGSAASRMLRALAAGAEACLTVTLVDGLVVARSLFNSSMNYRSVVVLGRGTVIEEYEAKMEALKVITERLIPGRWDEARVPTAQEMKGTTVMSFPITEASAKVRAGGVKDEAEDYALPIWAGVLPLGLAVGVPEPDALNLAGVEVPGSVLGWKRS